MSKRFQYWARCASVAVLSVIVTINPLWAQRGLRGWLKKRSECKPACQVIDCCTPSVCEPAPSCCEPEPVCCDPAPTCEPAPSCCETVVSGCDAMPAPECAGSVIEATPWEAASEPEAAIDVAPPADPPEPDVTDVPEIPAEVAPAEVESPSDIVAEPEVPESPFAGEPEEPEFPAVEPEVPAVEPEVPAFEPEVPVVEPEQPELPIDDDLFGEPKPAADPAAAGDDLFGEPAGEVPAEVPAADVPAADDLFGAPAGDAAAPAGDDLFGAPAGDAAAPAGDDLFGAPAGDAAAPAGDDLFGEGEDATPPSADDLFGQPTSTSRIKAEKLDLDALFGSESNDDFAPSSNEKQQRDPIDDLFKTTQKRLWNDNTGSFAIDARLAEIRVDSVRLLKNNGKYCTVPMRRLSLADKLHVQRIAISMQQKQQQAVQFISTAK